MQREEAGNEFPFQFLIPAGGGLPGPIQEPVCNESQPLSRLRRDELTRMWANGLTLCRPLAQAASSHVMWLLLSSAQPLLDESCEKLIKLLCGLSSSFGEMCMKLVSGGAAFPDPASEIRRPGGPGLVECVFVMALVMGCQKLDYSETVLAVSSAGLGEEVWEPRLLWTLERAGVDLFNILGSNMAGVPLGTPMPPGGHPMRLHARNPQPKVSRAHWVLPALAQTSLNWGQSSMSTLASPAS